MKPSWPACTHRVLARGPRIVALASCLVAGAGISQSVAHAASRPNPPSIIAGPCGTFAKHDVLSAHGVNYTGLTVRGTCFPPLSTAYLTIRDLTRGEVLARSVAVRVSVNGGFAYSVPRPDQVKAPGPNPNDKMRIRVTDGRWHTTLNYTIQEFLP